MAIFSPQVMIYDSLSGKKIPVPNKKGHVGIYVCGLTVYDNMHLGHARLFVVFDVLRRLLRKSGYQVTYVQNFTDVDDKVINRARELRTSYAEVAKQYIESYFKDADSLNITRADIYPRASEHIQEIIELIKAIERKGSAYKTENGVYFRVSSFPNYGKLSHQSTENLRAGARVEVDPQKEDPLDFSLWKFHKDDPYEPAWDSPWGKGRPGWHIECSAMSMKYLGETIDVHGGGQDLIFPHHENEIAQSETATGKLFARAWVHVGLLSVGGEKMAKSLKNFTTVKDALSKWGPDAVRLFLLSSHYRSPLPFSEDAMNSSAKQWIQIEQLVAEALHHGTRETPPEDAQELSKAAQEVSSSFVRHVSDDLSTQLAISDLMSFAATAKRIVGKLDGLTEALAQDVLSALQPAEDVLGLRFPQPLDELEGVVQRRFELRKNGQFEEADNIRNQLAQGNVVLVDHRDHTIWFRSSVPDAHKYLATNKS